MLRNECMWQQQKTIKKNKIVTDRSACFGQDNTITENVHPSDVSTVAMESITPLWDQYWCRVDEFMESGNLNDLCPEPLDTDDDIDLDSVNKSFNGFIVNGITGNEDNILSKSTHFISIPFSINAWWKLAVQWKSGFWFVLVKYAMMQMHLCI